VVICRGPGASFPFTSTDIVPPRFDVQRKSAAYVPECVSGERLSGAVIFPPETAIMIDRGFAVESGPYRWVDERVESKRVIGFHRVLTLTSFPGRSIPWDFPHPQPEPGGMLNSHS
jgi:hypothetical protein